MEWITLNNLSLGNQINVNFATEWSKDGRLFLLSDACVFVLKLSPKMTNTENILSFTRSEIKLCDYYAADHTGINIENILLNLSQENMYHQILNTNLTPRTKFTNLVNIAPVSAAWSPILGDEIYKRDALLGVVSTTGNLEILIQNRFKWYRVANITDNWIKHLQEEWTKQAQPRNDDKLAEIHSNRVNSALVTCFVWSKIYNENGENFMYIIVGHLNNFVSLWKINYFNSHTDDVKVEYTHSFKSDLDNITAIHYHYISEKLAWIILGDIDGTVQNKILNFDNLDEIKTVDIWTHKDVRVSKIVSVGFDQCVGIIAIKGPYLIFAVLSKDGTLKSTSHSDVGNLNISGIQLNCPGNYVITTTTGVLKSIKIVKTSKGYEMKLNPIINDFKWEYHACYGIIKSPCEIIWGILTYPCKMTDHLALRTPIQLVFCTEKDFDPGSYLKNSPSMQLLYSWECVEILRCQSIKNNVLPCSWVAKIEKFDDLSLYEVRLFMWLSLICESLIQKKLKFRKLKSTLPPRADLKDILYFKYRIERINIEFNKCKEGKKLTEFDYHSLYLLYDGIKTFQKDEIYSKYFETRTNEIMDNITEKYNEIKINDIPICLWCEAPLTSKQCIQSHPDQRCCISGVQIGGIAKWECDNCGLPAHESNEDEEFRCPLCDIPMIKIT